MSTLPSSDPTALSANDIQLARASSERLAALTAGPLRLRLENADEPIELPAQAVRVLVEALSAMSRGTTPVVVPVDSELTTQEAADLLGVSRPYLIERLDEGAIPHRKVGTHRRILLGDLLHYKNEVNRKRRQVLAELTAEAQELDMGY